jgi:hypothetical protein
MAVSAFLLLQTNLGFSFSLIPFILTISWPCRNLDGHCTFHAHRGSPGPGHCFLHL